MIRLNVNEDQLPLPCLVDKDRGDTDVPMKQGAVVEKPKYFLKRDNQQDDVMFVLGTWKQRDRER